MIPSNNRQSQGRPFFNHKPHTRAPAAGPCPAGRPSGARSAREPGVKAAAKREPRRGLFTDFWFRV